MIERAIAAFRLNFERTLNEGESLEEAHKIPRIKTGWPCERDFAKWPIVDQEEWIGAVVQSYLEEGLRKGGGDEKHEAMGKAWIRVGEFLEHIGVDMDPSLGKEPAHELLLAHYKRGNRYDCEQVVLDYMTFPPIAARIRELKREQARKTEAQTQARREQAKKRKRRWRERQGEGGGANGSAAH